MKKMLPVGIAVVILIVGMMLISRTNPKRSASSAPPVALMRPGESPAGQKEALHVGGAAANEDSKLKLPATGADALKPAATPGMAPAVSAEATRDPGAQAGGAPPAGMEQALELIKQGKKYEARAALTPMLLTCQDAAQRARIKAELDKLSQTLFFSPTPTPDSEIYTVQEGDTLWKIARDTGNGVDLIKLVNQKSSDTIAVGQKLKIMKGAFSVLVEKSHFRLIALLNDQYIKEYPVGIGADDKTPVGEFEIGSRKMEKNPQWTAPDGKIYPYGDPGNILGTRWIGFKETAQYSGYGIHGTTEPESIGKPSSNGCVRMHNKDVEDLFGMLKPGDKVTIRE